MKPLSRSARLSSLVLVVSVAALVVAGCGSRSHAEQRVSDQTAAQAKLASDASTSSTDATTSDDTSAADTASGTDATTDDGSTGSSSADPTTPTTASGSGTSTGTSTSTNSPTSGHAAYQARLDALATSLESAISTLLETEVSTTSGGAADTSALGHKADDIRSAADALGTPSVPADAAAGNAKLAHGMHAMADFLDQAARQLASVPQGQELQAVLALAQQMQSSPAFREVDAGEKALDAAGYTTGTAGGGTADLDGLLGKLQGSSAGGTAGASSADLDQLLQGLDK